jgi:hypothetical protein
VTVEFTDIRTERLLLRWLVYVDREVTPPPG